jgi:hypothetical protein
VGAIEEGEVKNAGYLGRKAVESEGCERVVQTEQRVFRRVLSSQIAEFLDRQNKPYLALASSQTR